MLLLRKMQVLYLLSLFFFFSCSIDYSKEAIESEKRPNLVFKNIKVDRYKESEKDIVIFCERLEMYNKDKIWAGKKITFNQINKQTKEDEFKGNAGSVLIDNKGEEYFLSNNVEFISYKEKLKIFSPSLYWQKNAHLLSSSVEDEVSITKENEMSFKGKGFIANTASKEFELTSEVEGVIDRK